MTEKQLAFYMKRIISQLKDCYNYADAQIQDNSLRSYTIQKKRNPEKEKEFKKWQETAPMFAMTPEKFRRDKDMIETKVYNKVKALIRFDSLIDDLESEIQELEYNGDSDG